MRKDKNQEWEKANDMARQTLEPKQDCVKGGRDSKDKYWDDSKQDCLCHCHSQGDWKLHPAGEHNCTSVEEAKCKAGEAHCPCPMCNPEPKCKCEKLEDGIDFHGCPIHVREIRNGKYVEPTKQEECMNEDCITAPKPHEHPKDSWEDIDHDLKLWGMESEIGRKAFVEFMKHLQSEAKQQLREAVLGLIGKWEKAGYDLSQFRKLKSKIEKL